MFDAAPNVDRLTDAGVRPEAVGSSRQAPIQGGRLPVHDGSRRPPNGTDGLGGFGSGMAGMAASSITDGAWRDSDSPAGSGNLNTPRLSLRQNLGNGPIMAKWVLSFFGVVVSRNLLSWVQRTPGVLAAGLTIVWAANFALTMATPGDQELYPMTAWPMFSHELPDGFAIYHLLVQPVPDAVLLELRAAQAFDPVDELDANDVNTIMGSIVQAYQNGCPDHVLRGNCPGEIRDGWKLPGNLAVQWAESSMQRLDLEDLPHAITLAVDVSSPDGTETQRFLQFTFWPAQGPLVEPAGDFP